MTSSKT